MPLSHDACWLLSGIEYWKPNKKVRAVPWAEQCFSRMLCNSAWTSCSHRGRRCRNSLQHTHRALAKASQPALDSLTSSLQIRQVVSPRQCHPRPSRAALYLAGIPELVSLLQSRGTGVFLVSGGFRVIIDPIADILKIPRDHVFANRILFDVCPSPHLLIRVLMQGCLMMCLLRAEKLCLTCL